MGKKWLLLKGGKWLLLRGGSLISISIIRMKVGKGQRWRDMRLSCALEGCLKGDLTLRSSQGMRTRNSLVFSYGFMCLKSPCNKPHAKKMLGKYSNARPTTFGDVVHLLKYFHVDKGCSVIGELPGPKGNGKGANNTKWVLKTLVEQIDNKQDF